MKDIDMSLHPERFQPHLFTLYPKMPWRFIDNLPVEWSHLICKCDRFNYVTNHDDPGKQPPKCGNCKKVSIMSFNLCGGCDTFYIRNFTHPAWCNYCEQLCWNCCQENTQACCKANSWHRNRFPLMLRSPVGVYEPAKLYDQEELYNIPDLTF